MLSPLISVWPPQPSSGCVPVADRQCSCSRSGADRKTRPATPTSFCSTLQFGILFFQKTRFHKPRLVFSPPQLRKSSAPGWRASSEVENSPKRPVCGGLRAGLPGGRGAAPGRTGVPAAALREGSRVGRSSGQGPCGPGGCWGSPWGSISTGRSGWLKARKWPCTLFFHNTEKLEETLSQSLHIST